MGKLDIASYIKNDDLLDNVELNKEIISLFPFMKPKSVWTGKELDNYDYTWTEFNSFPTGWRKAFGYEMISEINSAILNAPEKVREELEKSFLITQIKEKFGYLRFYVSCATQEIFDIIHKYETRSGKICVHCGKPAKYISTGWVCPWCEDCIKDINDDYVTVKKWFAEFDHKDEELVPLSSECDCGEG